MRLARVAIEGKTEWCVIHDQSMHRLAGEWSAPRIGGLLCAVAEARLLAPIEPTNKVVGLFDNFSERRGRKGPGLFVKPPSAISGHEDEVLWPPSITSMNFEAELAVVIGRKAVRVSADAALGHVLGYTVGNDITSFDVLAEDGFESLSLRFKLYDGFMSIGPWIDTELDGDSLRLTSRLNGATKQDISTSAMVFGVAEVVAWVSTVMTLNPGDIISMGTPPGFAPMVCGDVVECEIEGIGILRNRIVSGTADFESA